MKNMPGKVDFSYSSPGLTSSERAGSWNEENNRLVVQNKSTKGSAGGTVPDPGVNLGNPDSEKKHFVKESNTEKGVGVLPGVA